MTRRSRVAWGIAGLDIVAFIVAILVGPETDPSYLLFGVVIASVSTVGAMLWVRVPANRIGGMLLAAGTIQATILACSAYAGLGLLATPPWPGSMAAAIVPNALFIYPIVIVMIGVPLIFPDGHLPSPRFRWAAWMTVVALVCTTIESLFKVGRLGDHGPTNPLGVASLAPALGFVNQLGFLAMIVGFGGAATAVWLRFRRGSPVAREQTKWLLAVAGLAAVAFPAAILATDVLPWLSLAFWLVGFLAFVALPLAIGVAVLRYRLYEIDRIVSRTIAYATVTGVLAAVFGGVVVLLTTVLSQFAQGQTVAVAASTLAVFAIFQPVLRRVRNAVDRRFNRARYDGERTSAAFAERLRHEVDLPNLAADLDDTVRRSVAPSDIGLWLRGGGR